MIRLKELLLFWICLLAFEVQLRSTPAKILWGGSFSVTTDKSLISPAETVVVRVELKSSIRQTYFVGTTDFSPFVVIGDSIRKIDVDSSDQVVLSFIMKLRQGYAPIVQTLYSIEIGVVPSTWVKADKKLFYVEKKIVDVAIKDPDEVFVQNPITWKRFARVGASFSNIVFHVSGAWFGVWGDMLFRSTSQGKSWEIILQPQSWELFQQSQKAHMKRGFFVACHSSGVVLLSDGYGFRRSTDVGKTWSAISICADSEYINDFYCTSDGSIFALGTMYKSSDAGLTWKKMNRGLENVTGSKMLELENKKLLVCGTQHVWSNGPQTGLYESNDLGLHWKQTVIKHSDIWSLASSGDSRVYASTQEGDLWKSSDGGENWSLFYSKTNRMHYTLIVNNKGQFFSHGYKYTGNSDNRSIFLFSDDEGKTWAYCFYGLPHGAFPAMLTIDPDGYLLAICDGDLFRTAEPFMVPK